MIAIEKSGTIQTFNRLPNEWNDEKGYHINFRKITNKEDYGFYDVVIPEYDKVSQQLSPIFWDADNKVFTYTISNIDFNATYPELDEEGKETGKTISVYDKDKLKADAEKEERIDDAKKELIKEIEALGENQLPLLRILIKMKKLLL